MTLLRPHPARRSLHGDYVTDGPRRGFSGVAAARLHCAWVRAGGRVGARGGAAPRRARVEDGGDDERESGPTASSNHDRDDEPFDSAAPTHHSLRLSTLPLAPTATVTSHSHSSSPSCSCSTSSKRTPGVKASPKCSPSRGCRTKSLLAARRADQVNSRSGAAAV